MKKLLLVGVFSVLILACTEKPQKIPEDISYSIIEEDRNDNFSKSNITVRINKKTTEEVLTEIAKEIKSDREDLENIFIFYYPDGILTSSFAWATSHFTPNLNVKILGSTEDEDIVTSKTDNIPGEILGKWRSDKSLMGATLIMYKDQDGKLYMQTNFKSGNPMTENLIESDSKGLKRYDYENGHGEYYQIEKNGNLGMYDFDGKYDEALRIE